MSAPHYPRFLSECITRVPDEQSRLRDDEMYGLYLSWCLLKAETPGSSESLWAALNQGGHTRQHPRTGRHDWLGVSMTGPAAVDYILSSRPSLLAI